MKARYYLTGLILVMTVVCLVAALTLPNQSHYVKWASSKYPKEALNLKVETTMKSYGVLDIFSTGSDPDTIKANGVVRTSYFAESKLPLTKIGIKEASKGARY